MLVPTPVMTAVTAAALPMSADTAEADREAADGFASSVANVVEDVFRNLGNNGYQTGVALIFATIAVVVMVNMKTNKWIRVPVALGAFWFGWLAWNTLRDQDNPLFPGDPSANKLWDVATQSDMGFLLAVAVACVAAVFLWRKGTPTLSRVWLIAGAVLGASFIFNLVEAIRQA